MAQPVSSQPLSPALPADRNVARAIVVGGMGLGAVMLIAALALWFHYGTAVFFETIAAGISACL
ncbi:hypothetical protein [Bradyrhizobium sp. dw_78]|uniref:hypothetical protein n=1 Tax=Bradyrhizobium sp. dw_78 TaxID=2719793 RepID=UPI001BD369B3|nr:hypothetical protein [Bradyrhizobium sp. dw_78]